jgi:peptidoglycan/LPS O-acetylase OafA/YrhL
MALRHSSGPGASRPRLRGLDTLRALAIVLVMLFHLQTFLPASLGPVAQFGWMGVDLFFVLSGYLIGTQLLRPYEQGHRPKIADFYRSRAYRILPAYLVVLGLYAFLPNWREAPGLSAPWQFLTFTENLFVDYRRNMAFSHAWSLCVEEHFYLLLPVLLIWLMRGATLRKAVLVGTCLVLTGAAVRLYVLVHVLMPLDAAGKPFWEPYIEQIYYPTYTHFEGLLVGVALAGLQLFRPAAWARIERWRHEALIGGSLLVALSCWLFVDRFESTTGPAAVSTVAGFPVLAVGLGLLVFSAVAGGGLLQLLPVPGAPTVARLAFSLYLTHKEAVHLCRLLLPSLTRANGFLQAALYGAACCVVASLLYFGVEKPFLLLRERRAHHRFQSMESIVPRDSAL